MRYRLPLFVSLLFLGCGGESADSNDAEPSPGDGTPAESDEFDAATLEEFRAAIPKGERLQVSALETDSNALTVGGTAELATLTVAGALAVNLPAVFIVGTLRLITLAPPTSYDAKTRTFVWGPGDNDDGYGRIAVTIQKNPVGDDFEYSYAFVRLVENDWDTAVPVIWGASTPGVDDTGIDAFGVTLWDIEANNAFMASEDPSYDPAASPEQGRFAMAYGHGSDEEGDFYFNVAVFRDFKGERAEPTEGPLNAEYFYGHYESNAAEVVDFVDFEALSDVCDGTADRCFENDVEDDAVESLQIFSAFFNGQAGRGEAVVSGGDLDASVEVAECWDETLDEVYAGISLNGLLVDQGGACPEPLDQTLEALGVPTLADVDTELLDALSCVAEQGIGGDCE